MPPDIGGDILSEATRLDAAEAVAIHVRPEVHALICRQAGADPDTNSAGDSPCTYAGIRLVVDGGIPVLPGYEIHRAVPALRGTATTGPRSVDRLSRPA
jgi:hypothetical protein